MELRWQDPYHAEFNFVLLARTVHQCSNGLCGRSAALIHETSIESQKDSIVRRKGARNRKPLLIGLARDITDQSQGKLAACGTCHVEVREFPGHAPSKGASNVCRNRFCTIPIDA